MGGCIASLNYQAPPAQVATFSVGTQYPPPELAVFKPQESEHQRTQRLRKEGLARQQAAVEQRQHELDAAHHRSTADSRWRAVAPLLPALCVNELDDGSTSGRPPPNLELRTEVAAVLVLKLRGGDTLTNGMLRRAAAVAATQAEIRQNERQSLKQLDKQLQKLLF